VTDTEQAMGQIPRSIERFSSFFFQNPVNVTYVFYRVSYVFWKNGSQRFQLRNSIAFILIITSSNRRH